MNIKDLIEYLVDENVTVHISISANTEGGNFEFESSGDQKVSVEGTADIKSEKLDAPSEPDLAHEPEPDDPHSELDASSSKTEMEEDPEFDEVFSEETEESDDGDGPTEEDRDEAAADFEELFG